MAKIICEVCGTAYPDSSDCCPICGYNPKSSAFAPEEKDQGNDEQYMNENTAGFEDSDLDLSEFEDGPMEEETQYQDPQYQQYQDPQYQQTQYQDSQYRQASYQEPPKPAKQIFDYDAVNPPRRRRYDDYEDAGSEMTLNDYPEDSYDTYDPNVRKSPKSHAVLVVFLVLMIVALIAASGYLMVKFILPNMDRGDLTFTAPVEAAELPETTEAAEAETEEIPATASATDVPVPCEILTLVGDEQVELTRKGQFYLIHASASPENTTDAISYDSEDESVVTVEKGGKITAVGEGSTAVIVSCGTQVARLPVTVSFRAEETEAAPTEEMPPLVTEPEAAEETAAPEEDPNAGLKDVELKLKKTDLSSGARGVSFTLELDCDLTPEEVTWDTTNGAVAVVKNGVVTTVGPGICKIVVQYGTQEVTCVVRCIFEEPEAE